MATNPASFIKETQAELRKVTWPKQHEVVRLTLVVIAISVFVGLFIGSMDYAFTWLTERLIK